MKSEIVTIYTQKVYLEIFASKILNRYNKLDAEIFNITISAIPKCDWKRKLLGNIEKSGSIVRLGGWKEFDIVSRSSNQGRRWVMGDFMHKWEDLNQWKTRWPSNQNIPKLRNSLSIIDVLVQFDQIEGS